MPLGLERVLDKERRDFVVVLRNVVSRVETKDAGEAEKSEDDGGQRELRTW